MPDVFRDRAESRTVAVVPLEAAALQGWLRAAPASTRAWVAATGFAAEPGRFVLEAAPDGRLARVLLGIDGQWSPWALAALPESLPAGRYRLDAALAPEAASNAALGWGLGGYRFTRYRDGAARPARELVWPQNADRAHVRRAVAATELARDLINTPAGDMGPAELAEAAARLARAHKARLKIVVGDALLKRGFPTIHAVGRASAHAPRLIDLAWGPARAPKLTLVGKGVCFDTGGLDLKSASNMLRMKKDMGGAAIVLGLASMIMDAGLPVRLRVLVPAVENSVAGNALRPLDVVRTRKGITVEVGNTDAEGRLVLCDALAAAEEERPALLIDVATLTGAARTALGPELPALFCNDDALAEALLRAAAAVHDPLWRLPLWAPYRALLDSRVADISNVADGPMAGAITAALYLREFVDPATPWVHLDVYGWNNAAKPGRPAGGEAQALRALYALVQERFRKTRT